MTTQKQMLKFVLDSILVGSGQPRPTDEVRENINLSAPLSTFVYAGITTWVVTEHAKAS